MFTAGRTYQGPFFFFFSVSSIVSVGRGPDRGSEGKGWIFNQFNLVGIRYATFLQSCKLVFYFTSTAEWKFVLILLNIACHGTHWQAILKSNVQNAFQNTTVRLSIKHEISLFLYLYVSGLWLAYVDHKITSVILWTSFDSDKQIRHYICGYNVSKLPKHRQPFLTVYAPLWPMRCCVSAATVEQHISIKRQGNVLYFSGPADRWWVSSVKLNLPQSWDKTSLIL